MAEFAPNPAQRQAVEHESGPLLVLAGAGSGKTGVVTRRIARLIERGAAARSILAMTFTNKAADEMRERVVRLVGARAADGLTVSTFHRFGLEVIKAEHQALGLRGKRFALVDFGDASAIVRDLLRTTAWGRNFDIAAILTRISLAKNAFIGPEAYAAAMKKSEHPYDEATVELYGAYLARLEALQAYDLDDLVCQPVILWRRRPEVLQRWQERYRFVIVDEYQDTNLSQLELLRLLVDTHRNVCAVGDDDQAIYAWRGADVRNILEFERHFPGTKVVRLETNYRSQKPILDVANAVIGKSSAPRHEKVLVPARTPVGAPELPTLVTAPDGVAEVRFVADEVKRLLDREGLRPRDVAVLYRSNLLGVEVETELRARGVPLRMVGGTQLVERKEVKDVLAYLQVAIDHDHELGARRAVNYPPRGVGDAALMKLASYATARQSSLFDAMTRAHELELPAAAREGCRTFVRIVSEIERGFEEHKPSAEVVRMLVDRLGLKAQLQAEAGGNLQAAARRWGGIEYLLRAFGRRDAIAPMNRAALGQFLRALTLREETEEEVPNAVTLSTVHGAKGLEFGCVFVIGLEEGILPHVRSTEERATDAVGMDGRPLDDVEQERRLFYVAVTRAKQRLWLCHAAARARGGKAQKRAPSRFLADIPEELVVRHEVGATPPVDVAQQRRGAADVLAALAAAGVAPARR
ncbi:MAG: UvrD-helicase domain-containing protein [Myxococcales bacterium]|nr:UvrD-helicase domain-containing protein [Myxococcales bacterium]